MKVDAVRGADGVRHRRVCAAQDARRGAHATRGRSGATMRGVMFIFFEESARCEAQGGSVQSGRTEVLIGALLFLLCFLGLPSNNAYTGPRNQADALIDN